MLGDKGHPLFRQYLFEQLAQADTRHRRRHGRNLKDFQAGQSFKFSPDVIGAVHAEDCRQTDDLCLSGSPFQLCGEFFAGGWHLQGPGHDLRIYFTVGHIRKSDTFSAKARPAVLQIGNHLAAAEAF